MTAAATAPDQGTAAPTPEGALSQLIREANVAGITYQEMADRGLTPEGNRLPKQWYQKLVKTPPVNPPSVPQMHAIAAAIRKPLRRIQEAAAHQWLMYETTELSALGDSVRIIVSHLAVMPESEKRKWQAMIEAAERARRESDE